MNPTIDSQSLFVVARRTLVAPHLKVMYTPTAKVACTTIKWMLAEAEGSLNRDVIPRLLSASMNVSQTIHNRHVSGLRKLTELPLEEARHILTSPEWVRIAAVRDPIARTYSAWENRIFMRLPGRMDGGFTLSPDVLVDGCIDMTASFAKFVAALHATPAAIMRDHHFAPQHESVHPDAINYDLLARADEPAGIEQIAAVLRERSGKDIHPRRHNESMGIPLERIVNLDVASSLSATYHADYQTFALERRNFPVSVNHYILNAAETQLVALVRQSVERVASVSQVAQSRMSARYGLRQIRKVALRRLSFGRMYNTPRGMHW